MRYAGIAFRHARDRMSVFKYYIYMILDNSRRVHHSDRVPQTLACMSLHVFQVAQLSFALAFVFILRFIYRQSVVRYTLRHVPGPKPSSLIWGEEWKLYHDAPGALYVNIHKKFGKVVKFTGAFGVSLRISLRCFQNVNIHGFIAPNAFHIRSSSCILHSGRGSISISQALWCPSMVQSAARRGYIVG